MASRSDDRLRTYKAKRDFGRTPEPSGDGGRKSGRPPVSRTGAKTGAKSGAESASRSTSAARRRPRFVVQKHAARRPHYDFRLEVEGALASWAVPKGPSLDPGDKRLAVRTEDHPLDYIDFEGVIPDGEYGAGPVIVWDRGVYGNLMADKDEPLTVRQSIERGHVEVWLEGEKLRGGFALVRMRPRPRERRENWLLVKMSDDRADATRRPVEEAPRSVVSGRTIEEVLEEEPPA